MYQPSGDVMVPSGYDVYIAMVNDGPNRNRWFTVLKNKVDLSMANSQCHNQMVDDFTLSVACTFQQ